MKLIASLLILTALSESYVQNNNEDAVDETVLRTQIKNLRQNVAALKKVFHIYNSFFKRISDGLFTDIPDCPNFDDKPKSVKIEEYNLPSSCANVTKTGVYELYVPKSGLKPFTAYCMLDPDGNGSAWTILMKRQDGKFGFYKDIEEYKHGFGNFEEEHWIGLRAIHAMTYFQRHELWMHLKGKSRKAIMDSRHSHFAINDEESEFKLNVVGAQYGKLIDNIDHFKELAGNRFAIDTSVGSPSIPWWWHQNQKDSKCCFTGNYAEKNKGLYYKSFNDKYGEIVYVLMAIRPFKY